MARPDSDRARCLAIFRLALAENCTMQDAARRIDGAGAARTITEARAHHGQAMRALYARGYGRRFV